MDQLTIVPPRIDRERAVAEFRRRTWRRALRTLRMLRPESVIEFYIPYHLFRVVVTDGGKTLLDCSLAFDALGAALDPVDADGLEIGAKHWNGLSATPETHRTVAEVSSVVPDRVRKIVHARFGGFRLASPKTVVELIVPGVYFPYWIGLYRNDDFVDVEVLNGLTGNPEGGKIREIVAQWLSH